MSGNGDDALRRTSMPAEENGDDDGVAADEAAAVVASDLEQLQSERTELVDTLRRVQADFENYRKRVLREQTALVDRATDRLIEQLLPILDSFEGALNAIGGSERPRAGDPGEQRATQRAGGTPDVDQLLGGVQGIHAQLMAVLEKAGLERIDAQGEPFDPNEHEAVLHDEGAGEPHVAETMRTGYRLKGKVIRPAMVKVTRQEARQ
jgi:molecular chaperone GrpE